MPAFFFYGDDVYSLNQKLKFWKIEFEKKYGDLNTAVFEGKSSKGNEIIDAASSVPFLAEKRLVLVTNFLSEIDSEEHESVADFLTKIPDTTVIIFAEKNGVDKRISLYKKLSKLAQTTEFILMKDAKLITWIESFVKKHNGSIERDAAIHLSQIVGGDLYRLENEIIKLVNSISGRTAQKTITKDDIDSLITSSLTTTIFKLTDALSQKSNSRAVHELHTLIESGEELHSILYMIMRQFRLLTAIKDLADRGIRKDEIVSILKEHPFVVSNTLSQTRNFSQNQLRQAYDLLLEIDTRLKTGGIHITKGDNREFVLALDRLVMELCR